MSNKLNPRYIRMLNHVNLFFIGLFFLFIQLIISTPFFQTKNILCFVFLNIFMYLPIKTDKIIFHLTLAFLIGIIVGAFYNSIGPITAATVAFVYSRFIISKIFLPSINISRGIVISLKNIGLFPFFVTLILPILIFCLTKYLLEFIPFNFSSITTIITKVFSSFILTFLINSTIQIFSILKP